MSDPLDSETLRQSLNLEKEIRNNEDVQDCEVMVTETRNRVKHTVKVLLKPQAEMIELDIPVIPLTSSDL